MLNTHGKGYIKNVKFGLTEKGNWYMRFYLVDESGEEWLCKTLNREYEDLQAGCFVAILDGTWRKWKVDDKVYSYLEVSDMSEIKGKDFNRQKKALELANEILP